MQGQELFAQLDAAERGLRDARRGRATAEGELHGVREQNHRLRQAAAACRCVGLSVDLPLWLAALPRGAEKRLDRKRDLMRSARQLRRSFSY